MVFRNNFVAVVKVGGKILREDKDLVQLPFGSEYSILLKNLESRKCLINITVDNQDVLDNNSLILNPNSEMELEGFMRGMVVKNKFKFIRKTSEISEYRGDRIDDGIIRIEYWFEKFVEKKNWVVPNNFSCNGNCFNCCYHCMNRKYFWYTGTGSYSIGSASGSASSYSNTSEFKNAATNVYQSSTIGNSIGSTYTVSNNISSDLKNLSLNQLDEGITVKGSEINQQFQYGLIGDLESNSRVIILKLIGYLGENKPVIKPITVKTKKVCNTCGKKSKSHIKFCSNCGTFLE